MPFTRSWVTPTSRRVPLPATKRVAEHRAKRVYDFLVSKGVNPKQLNYEGKGNSPDPFKKVQAANRAAIIQ